MKNCVHGICRAVAAILFLVAFGTSCVRADILFGGWTELPGGGTTNLSDTATNYNGKLYVFGIGFDHAHYVNVFDGTEWTGWKALPGGGTTNLPDAATVYNGKLYLFGIGIGDHAHYVNVFDGTEWAGWKALPGGGTTNLSDAATSYNGKLYVFGIGFDRAHYVNTFDGAQWTGWRALPGGGTTNLPDAATSYNGKLYVFGIGFDHAHYVNTFDGMQWTGWRALPGGGTTNLQDTATVHDGSLCVFGVGINDHSHYMNAFDGGQWTGWKLVPGGGTTNLADAAAEYAGVVYLFGIGIGDHGHYVNTSNKKSLATSPRYNEVAFKATHNSYWVKRDNVVEAEASGTQERILDQLLFEGVRSIELDIHRDDPHAHQFTIYHTDKASNSLCLTVDECMKELVDFHHALPQHDVVTIVLELKEVLWGGPFDDNHTPGDLDLILERYLGPYLYRPRDLFARCGSGATVRGCLKQSEWPSVEGLRGKFIVTILGNWNGVAGPASELCGPHSIDNRGSWVAYANKPGGIAARSAFLMESPWATPNIACQSSFTQPQVDLAVAAAGFVQLEINDKSGTSQTWVQQLLSQNIIFRGDVGGDNKPTMSDQAALVAAKVSLIQNDNPWFAWSDGAPSRPGIPIFPTRLLTPYQINEPGHRIFLIQERVGTSATVPVVLGGRPSTRWETTVAETRPATDSSFGNPRRPRGIGCIYARTFPDIKGNSQYGIRICRTTADGHWNVSKPLGEDAIVTVDVTQNSSVITSAFYSNGNDTNGAGELLRLDLNQTATGNACATVYSTELVIGDDPQWKAMQNACFPVPLGDQGLSAENGDVLFVGTKLAWATDPKAPAGTNGYFEPSDSIGTDYAVLNLTWPRPTPEPPCQKDQAGVCVVGIHRSFSTNGGHFYSADIREASSWGFDVESPNYFYLETSGSADRAALYRCYNSSQNRHFYTTASNCEGYGSLEFGIGYVGTRQLPGSVPLYRSYSATQSDHLYSIDKNEATHSTGYAYEFIVGYVWPARGLIYTGPPIP